jgi:hypothetical protein
MPSISIFPHKGPSAYKHGANIEQNSTEYSVAQSSPVGMLQMSC